MVEMPKAKEEDRNPEVDFPKNHPCYSFPGVGQMARFDLNVGQLSFSYCNPQSIF